VSTLCEATSVEESRGALAGSVAVVTGASRGIGGAVALALAQRGAALCLVGRHRDALQAVANAVPRGRAVHLLLADLGEEDAVRRIADRVERHVGHVDILIHGAGLYGRGTLLDASIEQLDLLYKVNVRGPTWARSTSSHVQGADTGAPGRARTA